MTDAKKIPASLGRLEKNLRKAKTDLQKAWKAGGDTDTSHIASAQDAVELALDALRVYRGALLSASANGKLHP